MPVYSSHLDNYEGLRLGERIRAERQRIGLTLKDLAGRVAISTARLSEIENAHHVLDLRQVVSIAEALSLPPGFFLPEDTTRPFQISRDSEVRSQAAHRSSVGNAQNGGCRHVEFWPLASLFSDRRVEPALGRIGPASGDSPYWSHPHEEGLLFVLKGHVEFMMNTPSGTEREEVSGGDSLYFRSDLPHRLRSLDEEPAECLHAFCSASGMASAGFEIFATALRNSGHGNVVARAVERLRLLREMQGWEQRHVAGLVNVPERQLAQIERGERPIRLDLLLKLARVYRKPLRELIGEPVSDGPYYFLQRAAETATVASRKRRTPVERPGTPASKMCQPLAGGYTSRSMYPYVIRLLNVDLDTLTLHEHHGHEFIYVLDGQLELTTFIGSRGVTDVLRPGDSIYLDSSVPHLLRGQTRSPFSKTMAEVIDVFWCPLGEEYLFGD